MEPLIGRAAGAILFHRPGSTVPALTTGHVLDDIRAVASRLPPARHIVNLCQDRYRFAVTFAACALQGRICLLGGEPEPRALEALRRRFDDAGLADDTLLPQPGASPATGREVPQVASDLPVAIAFTSGSTGEPAGAVKRWGELVARSRAAAARFALDGQTMVGTVPPQHMYGFETTVLLPLHAEVSSWCGPVFYPADIDGALRQAPGRRLLVTTPVHLRALSEHGPQRPPEQVISATAPLEAAFADALERRWGMELHEIFGATELGSIASRRTSREPDWRLYPGVALVPSGGGRAPGDREGEAGTLVLQAPHAEAAALADHVELSADGRGFRLLGRGSDIVKLGGRRASLAGLTRILTRLEGVADGVFLAPDDLGQRPQARLIAIAVAPGRDPQALLEALRREVDPVFLPRRLILSDALPRNATGKLPRQALLALAAAAGGRDD